MATLGNKTFHNMFLSTVKGTEISYPIDGNFWQTEEDVRENATDDPKMYYEGMIFFDQNDKKLKILSSYSYSDDTLEDITIETIPFGDVSIDGSDDASAISYLENKIKELALIEDVDASLADLKKYVLDNYVQIKSKFDVSGNPIDETDADTIQAEIQLLQAEDSSLEKAISDIDTSIQYLDTSIQKLDSSIQSNYVKNNSLNTFTNTIDGLVPAPHIFSSTSLEEGTLVDTTAEIKYLRSDGTWGTIDVSTITDSAFDSSIKANYATKSELNDVSNNLNNYLTKNDASANYVKQDIYNALLNSVNTNSSSLATVDYVQTYVTSSAVSDVYATKNDVSVYATKNDVSVYATKEALTAVSDNFDNYSPSSSISSTYLTKNDASSTYVKQDIYNALLNSVDKYSSSLATVNYVDTSIGLLKNYIAKYYAKINTDSSGNVIDNEQAILSDIELLKNEDSSLENAISDIKDTYALNSLVTNLDASVTNNYYKKTVLDDTFSGIYSTINGISLSRANTTEFGLVKVGSNIGVSDGVISVSSANVTTALGYEPKSKLVVTDSSSSKVTKANTNNVVYLNVHDDSSVISSVKVQSSGSVTLTSNIYGDIVISAKDTSYSTFTNATNGLVPAPHNDENATEFKYLRSDGSWGAIDVSAISNLGSSYATKEELKAVSDNFANYSPSSSISSTYLTIDDASSTYVKKDKYDSDVSKVSSAISSIDSSLESQDSSLDAIFGKVVVLPTKSDVSNAINELRAYCASTYSIISRDSSGNVIDDADAIKADIELLKTKDIDLETAIATHRSDVDSSLSGIDGLISKLDSSVTNNYVKKTVFDASVKVLDASSLKYDASIKRHDVSILDVYKIAIPRFDTSINKLESSIGTYLTIDDASSTYVKKDVYSSAITSINKHVNEVDSSITNNYYKKSVIDALDSSIQDNYATKNDISDFVVSSSFSTLSSRVDVLDSSVKILDASSLKYDASIKRHDGSIWDAYNIWFPKISALDTSVSDNYVKKNEIENVVTDTETETQKSSNYFDDTSVFINTVFDKTVYSSISLKGSGNVSIKAGNNNDITISGKEYNTFTSTEEGLVPSPNVTETTDAVKLFLNANGDWMNPTNGFLSISDASNIYATRNDVSANYTTLGDALNQMAETLSNLDASVKASYAAQNDISTAVYSLDTSLKKTTSDYASSSTTYASSAAAISSSVSDLDTSVSNNYVKKSVFDASVSKLDASVSKLDASVSSNYVKISALDTSVSNLDASVSKLDASVSKLDASVSKLDASVSSNYVKISALDTSVSNLDASVSKLDASVSKLDASVSNLYNKNYVTSTTKATSSGLGLVSIGSNIGINANGAISLSSANVTAALGYIPSETDTDTHYTTHAVLAETSSSTVNTTTATTNSTTYLNILDNSTIRDSIQILGSGATSVSAKESVLTITSTDTDTWNAASGDTSGYVPAPGTDGTKKILVTSSGNVNWESYPSQATSSSLGLVSVGDNITLNTGKISLSSANVTTALGFTPSSADTNTHYTTHLYLGTQSAIANGTTDNTNTYLNIYDDSNYSGALKIVGGSATTVSTNAGVLTITSTDTWNAASSSTAGYVPAPGTGSAQQMLVASSGKVSWTTVPTATTADYGVVKVGSNISISGGTISLSSANVTAALGYNPSETSSSGSVSNYTTKLVLGETSSSSANATAVTGSAYLNLFDDDNLRNSIQIQGSGRATINAANGVLTIASTAYSVSSGSTAGLVPAPGTSSTAKMLCAQNGYVGWNDIPVATTSSAGVVKVGSGISVSNGTISVPTVSSSNAGIVPVTGGSSNAGKVLTVSSAGAVEWSAPSSTVSTSSSFDIEEYETKQEIETTLQHGLTNYLFANAGLDYDDWTLLLGQANFLTSYSGLKNRDYIDEYFVSKYYDSDDASTRYARWGLTPILIEKSQTEYHASLGSTSSLYQTVLLMGDTSVWKPQTQLSKSDLTTYWNFENAANITKYNDSVDVSALMSNCWHTVNNSLSWNSKTLRELIPTQEQFLSLFTSSYKIPYIKNRLHYSDVDGYCYNFDIDGVWLITLKENMTDVECGLTPLYIQLRDYETGELIPYWVKTGETETDLGTLTCNLYCYGNNDIQDITSTKLNVDSSFTVSSSLDSTDTAVLFPIYTKTTSYESGTDATATGVSRISYTVKDTSVYDSTQNATTYSQVYTKTSAGSSVVGTI